MEKRPEITIRLNTADKILETSGWLLLVLLWVLTLWYYPSLPDTIPIHYNAAGEVDNYGNKSTILILPVIATVLFLAMSFLNRYPHLFNYPDGITAKNASGQYTKATRLLRYLKTAIVLIILLLVSGTLKTSKGENEGLGPWFLPLILCLIFIPILFYIARSVMAKRR
jgi:uncharacterized membrane protein